MEPLREKFARETYYVPLLAPEYLCEVQSIAKKFRKDGKIVESGVSASTIRKSLEYANKRGFSYTVISSGYERENRICKLKNMKTGEESEVAAFPLP